MTTSAFVLHVDDEGPGVPEQRLEQVFEPHFRLAGQQQGYGLGLGIARNIAHSHGGEVSLQNLREGRVAGDVAVAAFRRLKHDDLQEPACWRWRPR